MSETLSSEDDGVLVAPRTGSGAERRGALHYLEQASSSRTSRVLVEASYPSGSVSVDSDWLAAGIWIEEAGSNVIAHPFADGGDVVPIVPLNRIAAGTYTYISDKAVGVYSDGTGAEAAVMDFSARVSISYMRGSGSHSVGGQVDSFTHDGEDLGLGTLTLADAGAVQARVDGENIARFSAGTSASSGGDTYTGQWGGLFYGNNAGDGAPLHFIGTFGASTGDTANAKSILGAFAADLQESP